MAILQQYIKRIQHPTEPDTWVEIRVPLTAGDLSHADPEATRTAMSLAVLPHVITAWSYEADVTPEACAALDATTFAWIDREIATASPVRDEAEKKDSASPSQPTTAQAGASTPVSSAT